MDAQFLVRQLRFARSELMRCLEGVNAADALVRVQPMNSIGWIVGHLASQEQFFWVYAAQQKALYPELYKRVGFGQPASTPDYAEMRRVWDEITAGADEYLDRLTPELLLTHFSPDGNRSPENVGTLLLRNTYHYWFHTGEAHAIRQQLGHIDLPQFVGDMSAALVSE
jgi:uncharacterized damage-inducible protein DinB